MARLLQIGGGYYLASGAGYYASVPPSLALSVVSTDFSEGATVTLRVTASDTWDESITVAYATSDGTGTAGVDYTATSGTVTLAVGETTADINVVTLDRSGVQASRTFTVTLSAPATESGDTPTLSTAAQTVTIADTDVALPIPHLVVSAVGSAPEEGQPFTFRVATVDLVPAPSPISFQYETQDGSATGGVDYTPTSGNTSILAGESSKDFTVQTLARSGYQGARTVAFTVVTANTTLDTPTATGTILDTEVPTGDSTYFEDLSAHGTTFMAESLKSNVDLQRLSGTATPQSWSYNPTGDTHPYAQDAAKVAYYKPSPQSGSATEQLRFIPERTTWVTHDSGSILITWDWFPCEEMLTNYGNIIALKMWQVWNSGMGWWSMMSHFSDAVATFPGQGVILLRDEFRSGHGSRVTPPLWQLYGPEPMYSHEEVAPNGSGAGTISLNQRTPTNGAGNKKIRINQWNRYVVEIKPNQPASAFTEWEDAYLGGGSLNANPQKGDGAWNMVSLWAINATDGIQRSLYRVPMGVGNLPATYSVGGFRAEWNSSKDGMDGEFVSYVRNVVAMHNYPLPDTNPEADTFIFRVPT